MDGHITLLSFIVFQQWKVQDPEELIVRLLEVGRHRFEFLRQEESKLSQYSIHYRWLVCHKDHQVSRTGLQCLCEVLQHLGREKFADGRIMALFGYFEPGQPLSTQTLGHLD